MNRATFFKSLAAGLAAAPAVAKVIVETEPKRHTFIMATRTLDRNWHESSGPWLSVEDMKWYFRLENGNWKEVAMHEPHHVVYGLDQNPLRFSA